MILEYPKYTRKRPKMFSQFINEQKIILGFLSIVWKSMPLLASPHTTIILGKNTV